MSDQATVCVLLVEPNGLLGRTTLATVQHVLGYRNVISVTDIVEARKMLLSHNYGLVICSDDQGLESGTDLLKELRGRGDTVPFVLTSVSRSSGEVGEYAPFCAQYNAAFFFVGRTHSDLLSQAVDSAHERVGR